MDLFPNLKLVFHWIFHLHWVPNATNNETNNMKYACLKQTHLWRMQRKLYSTGPRWGFALGVMQILGFALGVTQNSRIWGTLTPKLRSFELQWNVGFKGLISQSIPSLSQSITRCHVKKHIQLCSLGTLTMFCAFLYQCYLRVYLNLLNFRAK